MKLKAELHSHSHYSTGEKIRVEGLNSPKEMVEYAKGIGLDVLALTDHNELKGALEAEEAGKKEGLLVIKGEEVQTVNDKHVLGLGLSERIKPACYSVEETIDRIRAQGGIAIAPHPFDLANKGIRELALKCDAIEVFNSINLDRFSNRNARNFAEKHSMNSVAGSDAHCIEMVGHGITKIKAEKDIDSVLKAIRKGKTVPVEEYVPINVVQYWALKRFESSYAQVGEYIYENYSNPKRWVAGKLLGLTKKSPGKIDYFFKGLAYFSFTAAIFYSAAKNAKRIV